MEIEKNVNFGLTLYYSCKTQFHNLSVRTYEWLSSVRFKYKPGYRPSDLLQIQVPSLVENLSFKKNPLQDLLSSVNAVISTNERIEVITGLYLNLTDDNHQSP